MLEQQRGRAEHDDPQRPLRARVLVPEALDDLRPSRDLLHLVEDEQRAAAIGLPREQAGGVPLGLDPRTPTERRFVGTREDVGKARSLDDLAHQRRLAHLPGTSDHLDEPAGFAEAPQEGRCLRSRVFLIAHDVE